MPPSAHVSVSAFERAASATFALKMPRKLTKTQPSEQKQLDKQQRRFPRLHRKPSKRLRRRLITDEAVDFKRSETNFSRQPNFKTNSTQQNPHTNQFYLKQLLPSCIPKNRTPNSRNSTHKHLTKLPQLKHRTRPPQTHKKRPSARNYGISYADLLQNNHQKKYDPFILNDPRFKQGKHHTVMKMQSYAISIIPFVEPKKLKGEVNENFRELNPWLPEGITLSKLRNLKDDLFGILSQVPEIDVSTIACAWVYFERLVFKRVVHKVNRKLCAMVCLVLSFKFNQHSGKEALKNMLSSLLKLDRKENITTAEIFAVEFQVFVLLDFALILNYNDVLPHIGYYLDSKDLKLEDVYGGILQAPPAIQPTKSTAFVPDEI